MTFRRSLVRYSIRVAQRQLHHAAIKPMVCSTLLTSRGHNTSSSSSTPRTNYMKISHARFSSSDVTTCTEHKVDNCSRCTKEVNLDELTSLIHDTNLRLVDVREPYELREAGEIPNSVNIPLTQLKGTLQLESDLFHEKTGLQKPTKADSIVFYGMGSIRSVAALEIACKMGYTKARHYPGGWTEWSKVHN